MPRFGAIRVKKPDIDIIHPFTCSRIAAILSSLFTARRIRDHCLCVGAHKQHFKSRHQGSGNRKKARTWSDRPKSLISVVPLVGWKMPLVRWGIVMRSLDALQQTRPGKSRSG
jgi:hypothetical protein